MVFSKNSLSERLFYGLTRGLSNDYRKVEIVVDHSPEYGRMRVYSKLKQQMNAHAIYRGMKYYVNKAWYKESHKSIPLQIVDLFMGIVSNGKGRNSLCKIIIKSCLK